MTRNMVVDIEAIVAAPWRLAVAEQIAYVVVDEHGKELVGRKIYVRQTMDPWQLAHRKGIPYGVVYQSVEGYYRITEDLNIVHDSAGDVPWARAREEVYGVASTCDAIYAKGCTLERQMLPKLCIRELEDAGCPRYPKPVHDPLEECRFFAQYIPFV